MENFEALDREKLKKLLELKPAATRNQILDLYDSSKTLSSPDNDIFAYLSSAGIKSRKDLAEALEQSGLRFGTVEYDKFYDKFTASHVLPTI